VDLSGSDLLAEHRKAVQDPGSLGAPPSRILGHAKLVDAIGVQARAGARAVEATRLDFGQMSQKSGQDLIGTTDLATSAREQVSVRQVMQAVIRTCVRASYGVHAVPYTSQFRRRRCLPATFFRTKIAFLTSTLLIAREHAASARQPTSADDFVISCRDAPPKLSRKMHSNGREVTAH
jgi:hypothetical protein